MRLVVMSDTHGNIDGAEAAVKQASAGGPVDMIIHAGDHFSDGIRLQRRTGIPVIGVSGNRDYPLRGPLEEVFDVVDGVKIYITHGHEFSVKSRVSNLERRANELGADIVVYGHTHVPDLQWVDGKMFLNPGSLYQPRGDLGRTFAVIAIQEKNPKASIVSLKQ